MHHIGYKKDVNIVGKLVIDEETANIVRRIFDLFVNKGIGLLKISKLLTDEQVPTPAIAMKMNSDKESIFYNVWKSNTIRRILKNKTYLGFMIQNKEKTISPQNPKRVMLKEDEYIIIPNHHEPIIDEQTFYKAQVILEKNRNRSSNSKTSKTLLHDLLYCKVCGKKLAKKIDKEKMYYYCRTRTTYHICDNSTYIPYNKVEQLILQNIKELIKKYSNLEELNSIYISEYEKKTTNLSYYNSELKQIETSLEKINHKLEIIYMDKLNNIINAETYKKHSTDLKSKQHILEKNIQEIQDKINQENYNIKLFRENVDKNKKVINEFRNMKQVNEEVVKEFIEKIFVDKNKEISILYKFNF